MAKISVIIPARNEKYLVPTVEECFNKAGGDIEVVAVLEGYEPEGWAALQSKYTNLHTIYHSTPLGMRRSINDGAASAIARGTKYLFKLDAHCMLDEGWDVKLLANIEPNWIVVPRRLRLDAENWKVRDDGRRPIDYHYLSFPDNVKDFGGPGLNGKVWDERARERFDKPEYDIDDEMSSQGSGWFMAAEYFQQMGFMDEGKYGPFWNEFQELGMSCWLTGGSVKVNKKTWYAHLHKGSNYQGADGSGGRGYHLPKDWLNQGASFTKRWIFNDAGVQQTRPFKWLIEHFWPVPTWPDNWEELVYGAKGSSFSTVPAAGNSVGVSGDTDRGSTPVVAELRIIEAGYGISEDESIDVTAVLRRKVVNGSLDMNVTNSELEVGNPYRGQKKRLWVVYSYDGGEPVLITKDERDWLIIGQSARYVKTAQPAQVSNAALVAVSALASTESKRELNRRLDQAQAKKSADWIHFEKTPLEPVVAAESAVSEGDIAGGSSAASAVITDAEHLAALKEVHEKRMAAINKMERRGPFDEELIVPKSAMFDDQLKDPKVRANLSATALNDFLIRRFQIPSHRLRGPMPIEVPSFHRNDLAQLFAELGMNRGVEVGVAEANFSEILCKANPNLHLLCVDPWHAYSGNPQKKSPEKDAYAYNEAKRKLAPYPNVKLDMRLSEDAVRDVADNSLDWVYIDGHHGVDWVWLDLILWTRKVRSGGIIAGDDFYFLDPKRWGAGPVEAVMAYTEAHAINPWFTFQGHKSVDFMWVKGDWK